MTQVKFSSVMDAHTRQVWVAAAAAKLSLADWLTRAVNDAAARQHAATNPAPDPEVAGFLAAAADDRARRFVPPAAAAA